MQCKAKTHEGNQCKLSALDGTNFCHIHKSTTDDPQEGKLIIPIKQEIDSEASALVETEQNPEIVEQKSSFIDWIIEGISGLFAFSLVVGAAGAGFGLVVSYFDDIKSYLGTLSKDEILVYLVSWFLLFLLSAAALQQIYEIMISCRDNISRRRANQIAIMISLVSTIFLFKQPYLDILFEGKDIEAILGLFLFGGAAASGWFVWYLKSISKYGEFFHVFLLATATGFSWYARLTAPEAIQLVAVAFILGSLFRIAKDYLDGDSAHESV